MPRKLLQTEADEVWRRLLPWLAPPDPRTGFDGGYPDHFPSRLCADTGVLPDEPFLAAIREAMGRVGEAALFFLASEGTEEDQESGMEWEVGLAELTCQTLTDISPGLQCYLVSPGDQWAIFFHHEGIAYCGGTTEFIQALESACNQNGVTFQV